MSHRENVRLIARTPYKTLDACQLSTFWKTLKFSDFYILISSLKSSRLKLKNPNFSLTSENFHFPDFFSDCGNTIFYCCELFKYVLDSQISKCLKKIGAALTKFLE